VSVAVVTLRVPEALTAFALQKSFLGVVRLYFDRQTADFGETAHFRNARVSRYRQDEVRCEGTVLLGVLIPSPRSQLHDDLNLNVQCFQILPDLGFGHAIAQVFQH
jgi:hypothetical protein